MLWEKKIKNLATNKNGFFRKFIIFSSSAKKSPKKTYILHNICRTNLCKNTNDFSRKFPLLKWTPAHQIFYGTWKKRK